MSYIVFSINNHIQEFLFVFSYNKGEEAVILGELVKLNNLCDIKGYDFDFFEVYKDPNIVLFKQHIHIYKYETFLDAVQRLDLNLSPEELQTLSIQDKEVYNILTKKSKSEILSLLYQEDHKYNKLLKKLLLK